MTKTKKLHSKDYLLEHKVKKETPNWLGFLIQKVVDSNGKISNDDKDKIFSELLREGKIDIKEKVAAPKNIESIISQEKIETSSTNQKLTLQKITHIKGVNALISDQSIIFSPACTIIYGLNGTGKSGYFRILNELAGGDKTKTILGNIYKEGKEVNEIEVNIDFLLENKVQRSYRWQDKDIRGVVPFDQIKVFDSEYLPIFLDQRESSVNLVHCNRSI